LLHHKMQAIKNGAEAPFLLKRGRLLLGFHASHASL